MYSSMLITLDRANPGWDEVRGGLVEVAAIEPVATPVVEYKSISFSEAFSKKVLRSG